MTFVNLLETVRTTQPANKKVAGGEQLEITLLGHSQSSRTSLKGMQYAIDVNGQPEELLAAAEAVSSAACS